MDTAVEARRPDVAPQRSRLAYLGDKLITPVAVTVLGAALTAVVVPAVSARLQTHQEQLDVRTTLASKMSSAFADAVVSARAVVRGQIYSASAEEPARRAAAQAEFIRVLRDWAIASTDLNAQLRARYPATGLAKAWEDYSGAVRDYVRLGSVTPDRAALIEHVRAYAGGASVDWEALRREKAFKSDPEFLRAYDALGGWLLGHGDGLVSALLTNRPQV